MNSNQLGNVLVSSAGAKVPLIESLRSAVKKISPDSSVIAGDNQHDCISKFIADEFWLMPPTRDENLDNLIAGIVERNITVILPTRDGELPFWAKNKSRFLDLGVHVIVSDEDIISLCGDKLRFSEFGIQNGLPFIPSHLDASLCNSKKLVIKSRFGAGSKDLMLDATLDEAQKFSQKIQHPIFQPYVEGAEISVDFWMSKDGKSSPFVMRKRTLVIAGESQITEVFVDSALQLQVQEILTKLRLIGPAVLQAITVDKKLRIVECNARFGGASTAAIAAGLPIFELILREAWGLPLRDLIEDLQISPITQVRIKKDLHFQ